MKNSRGREGRPLPRSYSTPQVNQVHLIFGEIAALLCRHRHCLPIPQEVGRANVQLIVTIDTGRELWMTHMRP
jgi:hypothetical protein